VNIKLNNRKGIIALVTFLLVIVVILILIFAKPFGVNTRDRVIALLKGKPGRLQVKEGELQKLKNADLAAKYFEEHAGEEAVKKKDRKMLLQMLQYADSLGLDASDYHQKYLIDYNKNNSIANSNYESYEIENEVVFADAALSFLFDVVYGKDIQQIEFNGVDMQIDSAKVSGALKKLLDKRDWHEILDELEPKIAEYQLLKGHLNKMRHFVEDHPSIDSSVASLVDRNATVTKLQALGTIDENVKADSVTIGSLISGIKKFQLMVSVDTTGVLDKNSYALLNFPVAHRIEQVKTSLNYWRWTNRLKEKEFIFVNLPATTLRIVNRDSESDVQMRVIVGKPGTRTPSFTSYISKVITYPYWTVPYSIATKEILPKLKKSISYLEEQNIQVLDGKGKEIDPRTVNWNAVQPRNFPYTLRQSTGCDNALGVMKFDLNNPYSIYLHDTNRRDLFSNKNRFMSHGCVRVEEPFTLAQYVLGAAVDTNYLNQCLKTEKPKEFKLEKHFPVLMLYLTADITENGALRFYKDIYGYEKKLIKVS
jgi:murein L,D-transpeptidase YcbB/YkuD